MSTSRTREQLAAEVAKNKHLTGERLNKIITELAGYENEQASALKTEFETLKNNLDTYDAALITQTIQDLERQFKTFKENIEESSLTSTAKYSKVDRGGKINYTELTDSGIGVAERHGKRDTQEDRVLAYTASDDSAKLDDAGWAKALTDTAASLETHIETTLGDKAQSQGSCYLTTVVVGDKVHTANIGDSSAFIVTIDKDGNVKTNSINTWHKPTNPIEKAYIERINPETSDQTGFVIFDRLNGRLAVSRAIGDTEHGAAINHTPDIYHSTIDIPESGRAFVITACDGLTESLKENDEISRLIADNKDMQPHQLAALLARTAENNGSEDNISVIVTPVDPDDKSPKVACVFDGHGGSLVSEALSQQFEATLEKQVKLTLGTAPVAASAVAAPLVLALSDCDHTFLKIHMHSELMDALTKDSGDLIIGGKKITRPTRTPDGIYDPEIRTAEGLQTFLTTQEINAENLWQFIKTNHPEGSSLLRDTKANIVAAIRAAQEHGEFAIFSRSAFGPAIKAMLNDELKGTGLTQAEIDRIAIIAELNVRDKDDKLGLYEAALPQLQGKYRRDFSAVIPILMDDTEGNVTAHRDQFGESSVVAPEGLAVPRGTKVSSTGLEHFKTFTKAITDTVQNALAVREKLPEKYKNQFKNITSEIATSLLKENDDISYVIRPSSMPGRIAVSQKTDEKVKNYLLEISDDNKCILHFNEGGASKTTDYPSFEDFMKQITAPPAHDTNDALTAAQEKITATQAADTATKAFTNTDTEWNELTNPAASPAATGSTTPSDSEKIIEEHERIIKELTTLASAPPAPNVDPSAELSKKADENTIRTIKPAPSSSALDTTREEKLAALALRRIDLKKQEILARIEEREKIAKVRSLVVPNTPLVDDKALLAQAKRQAADEKAKAEQAKKDLDAANRALAKATSDLVDAKTNKPAAPAADTTALEKAKNDAQAAADAANNQAGAAETRAKAAEEAARAMEARNAALAAALTKAAKEREALTAEIKKAEAATEAARAAAATAAAGGGAGGGADDTQLIAALKNQIAAYAGLAETIKNQMSSSEATLYHTKGIKEFVDSEEKPETKTAKDAISQARAALTSAKATNDKIEKLIADANQPTKTLTELQVLASRIQANVSIAQIQADHTTNATSSTLLAYEATKAGIAVPPPLPPKKPRAGAGAGAGIGTSSSTSSPAPTPTTSAETPLIKLLLAIKPLANDPSHADNVNRIERYLGLLIKSINDATAKKETPPFKLSGGHDAQVLFDHLQERIARCAKTENPAIQKAIADHVTGAVAAITTNFGVTPNPIVNGYTLRTPKAIALHDAGNPLDGSTKKERLQAEANAYKSERSYEPLLNAYKRNLHDRPYETAEILQNCKLMREQLELYLIGLQEQPKAKDKNEAQTLATLDELNKLIDSITLDKRSPKHEVKSTYFDTLETIPLDQVPAKLAVAKAFSAGGYEDTGSTKLFKKGECTYGEITILPEYTGIRGSGLLAREPVLFQVTMSKETGRLNMDFHLEKNRLNKWKSLNPFSNEGKENFAKVAKATVDLFHQHPSMTPPMRIKRGTPEPLVKAILCYTQTQGIACVNNSGVKYTPTEKDIKKFKDTLSSLEGSLKVKGSGNIFKSDLDLAKGKDDISKHEDQVIGKDRPTRRP